MSEANTAYGVSYIAEAPQEFKVGDRVEVVDASDEIEKKFLHRQGRVANPTTPDGSNPYPDKVWVDFNGEQIFYFCPDQLRKLPDTTPDEPWNVAMFRKVTAEMADTYARKNATYNDSFGKSVEKYGFIAALTRMSDKFNRIENLILGAENKVPDESLKDSLLDLACYSVMTIVALRGTKIGDVDFENVV